MGDVDHDNFVELESRVLSNPVRVENAKTSTTTTDTFLNKLNFFNYLLTKWNFRAEIYLGDGLEVASRFQVVDTMAFRFAVSATLGHRALATTTANSDAVDHKS